MPNLAVYHPQVVHFVVGLLFVGVAFRLASLAGRPAFAKPAATALILLGTLATIAAVNSGVAAHGPVEAIPGVRAAVIEHETWGERTRNVFLGVAVLELLALGLRKRERTARALMALSAVAGLAGLAALYTAAARGGDLVYGYAGGPGIRSGDPADVSRLFVSGIYGQATLDRASGHADESAALIDTAARRFPENLDLQLVAVDWQIEVRKDPAGALHRLATLGLPAGDARLKVRAGILEANAQQAAGDHAAAVRKLEALKVEFPNSRPVQLRLQQLGGAPKP